MTMNFRFAGGARRSAFWAMALVMAVAVVGTLGGCAKPKDPNHVVVAMNAEFRPFEFHDEHGNIVGFDVDLFRAIAKQAGLTVEFKHQPFDGILEGLNVGHFDAVMSSLTITDERKRAFDFSDPYLDAGLSIAVLANNDTINGLDDLVGKAIAVEKATTGSKKANEIDGATVSEFASITDAFLELKTGRVVAVVNDDPVNRAYLAEQGGIKIVGGLLTDEKYGIAVRKGNAELLKKINDALAALKADGTIDQLKAKWQIQ